MKNKYLKKTPWVDEYIKAENNIRIEDSNPNITFVEEGYILPTKQCDMLSWGLGGVMDSNGMYVPESGIDTAFGGLYTYDKNVDYYDEEIVFIGIIPKQVGHLLIDSVCRLWIFLDEKYKNHKIAFCSYYWDTNPLESKFGEVFDLMGINRERLIHITKPVKCKRIVIPSYAMSFGRECYTVYNKVIEKMICAANAKCIAKNWPTYDKIYFNKRFYFPANLKQVGEKRIEDVFKLNGYTVLSPENYSLAEMIYLVNHCEYMASLSGTTSHYAMFSKSKFTLISLNRLPEPLRPQMRLDKLFSINNIYVDCYNERMLAEGLVYGTGVIWVEKTEELSEFLNDYEMVQPNNLKTFTKVSDYCEYVIKGWIYRLIPIVKRVIRR